MIACVPTGNELTAKLAVPDVRVPVPRDLLPAENWMLPVGTPMPELDATFAVNTTGLFNVGAAGEKDRVVAVAIKAGGTLTPELPFPPQPIVKYTEPNTTTDSESSIRLRRAGHPNITRPARLAIVPAPNHVLWDAPPLDG